MQQEAVFAGRYLLERRAGAGGMGEVWKALDKETGQPLALKRLPAHDPGDATRFAREAQILAGLSHPHVVRYIAHGADADGSPFLAMEWLEGEDLAARLARGGLSVEESVLLARCITDALAFAHACGVVHRDLKPSNLFLPGGRLDAVKVLDFGIARAARATRVTRTGMLIGTPGYMAPEQARGEPHVDARADVFSLGCVLFECLTGEPAFGGEHAAAILTKVLFEEAPSARSLKPAVPEVLDALVRRMLAKRREERPADGQAAAEALAALGAMPSGTVTESARSLALTGSEQRAVAVILVSAPEGAEPASFNSAPTVDMSADEALFREAARRSGAGAPTVDRSADEALLREAAQHNGAGERLVDGSVVVMMAGTAAATDLCAQAARCALALREPASGRRITLAMGRGERTGRSLGPVVDRAARLSGTTRSPSEGAVLIDEVVAGLLDARFEVREGEGFFTLHGERALSDGARLLLGKATPCVGRERELGTLQALFTETAEGGTAQAVVVTAPPGVGKSRLAQEFLQGLKARGGAVSLWIARGDAQRAGSPFGMLGQALRSACGIRDGEPLHVRQEKLSAEVAARIAPSERRRVAEFLGEIVGAPFPDDDSLPLRAARRDAQLMAEQLRAAFLDFLRAACGERPVVVLLEDLHWGDRPTVLLFDAALRDPDDYPLFVLAMARPEVREVFPKLWEGRSLCELRLSELGRRAGERLARHVLGQGADAETIARIVRLSEGNAFYLEELIRWTAEGKGPHVPETVVAMVESRLGALDDEARRLLRAASVFGEVFWVGGVAALVGGEARRSGITASLAALVEQEVLLRRRESRFEGEEELAFRHALLREGAYATLTSDDRTLGHRLAGQWLEARGEQDARALAEHFEKGGDWTRAGQHYLRAARQSGWGGDGLGAAALARRGIELPIEGELRVRLLGALCETSIWKPETAASMQREAEELVQVAARGSAPWVQGMMARYAGATVGARIEEVLAVVVELQHAEVAPDAVDSMALALGSAVFALDMMGHTRQADPLLARFEGLMQASADSSPIAMSLLYGCKVMRSDSGFFGSLRDAGKAREMARLGGFRRMDSVGAVFEAIHAWCLGAVEEAERTLRAASLSNTDIGYVSSYRPFALAWLLADRGALREAEACAMEVVALGRDRALPGDEGRGHWILAEVRRRAGDLDSADDEVGAAVATLRAYCPRDLPGALATKAALRLAQGRPDEALAAAEEGMALYGVTGMCSHFFRGAFLRLVHVESLEAAGRRDDARAALAEARARILAVAGPIDDPGYRTSFLESVPENRRTLALAREWLGEGG